MEALQQAQAAQYHAQALTLLQSDPRAALQRWYRALHLCPHVATYHYHVAVAQTSLLNLPAAIRRLQQVLYLVPSAQYARRALGVLMKVHVSRLFDAGRWRACRYWCEQGIEQIRLADGSTPPSPWPVRASLSPLAPSLTSLADAAIDPLAPPPGPIVFQAPITASPDYAFFLMKLLLTSIHLGQVDEARPLLDQMMTEQPDPALLVLHARIQHRAGATLDVYAALRRLRQIAPDHAAVAQLDGWVSEVRQQLKLQVIALEASLRLRDALNVSQQIMQLDPEDWKTHRQCARYHHKLGDYVAAITAYHVMLQNPERNKDQDAAVQRELAQVYIDTVRIGLRSESPSMPHLFGNLVSAFLYLATTDATDPLYADAIMLRATCEFRVGQVRDASETLWSLVPVDRRPQRVDQLRQLADDPRSPLTFIIPAHLVGTEWPTLVRRIDGALLQDVQRRLATNAVVDDGAPPLPAAKLTLAYPLYRHHLGRHLADGSAVLARLLGLDPADASRWTLYAQWADRRMQLHSFEQPGAAAAVPAIRGATRPNGQAVWDADAWHAEAARLLAARFAALDQAIRLLPHPAELQRQRHALAEQAALNGMAVPVCPWASGSASASTAAMADGHDRRDGMEGRDSRGSVASLDRPVYPLGFLPQLAATPIKSEARPGATSRPDAVRPPLNPRPQPHMEPVLSTRRLGGGAR
ncbi:hypothetical protein CXG81DRAFT_25910 [Caulochytrium protostelioides]|uniref:TPR-like protein n=1 Tax=Caulochytrium protostelioides TaxID=1555241 RepID=A0A4P9X823_9FUNG|nr:hypothetical protein CXG81DRAFT_25910 [Caulochytrium protostelioides]|eukprot:RKP01416.1 hypothetical protein CXG81DRAFT_25910 [Caulochytrium protostelioides]